MLSYSVLYLAIHGPVRSKVIGVLYSQSVDGQQPIRIARLKVVLSETTGRAQTG